MALALFLVAAVVAGAELPPEIAVDRLLVRAEWLSGEGQHRGALATLGEVLTLVEEHGLEAPDAFWYRHAQAASAAGEHGRAAESATRYLTTAGRDGEHYRAALELLEAADRKVQAVRQREAADRAERERRQAEARAYRDLWERVAPSSVPGGEGEVFADALRSGGAGPAMVVIPAGRFRMGCLSNDDFFCSENEKPRWVTIGQSFALSVYEVTFAEWDACVAAGGCGGYRPDDEGWGRGARPVIHVSWDDARGYAGWLSAQTGAAYRLPSESEWEYAARAGTETEYHWGDEIGRNRANCYVCGSQWDGRQTAPVGSFAANAWGLYDMHGNVFEWVASCGSYDSDYHRKLGQRPCSLRGGSWKIGHEDLRAGKSNEENSDYREDYHGFRVARTLTP